MRVLCAIPCFDEALAIGSIVVQAKPHVDAVLVVDDGSTDRTSEIARLAGADVLRHDTNLGKGKAVQAAFRYARERGFDTVVLLDGDGQHDPTEIPLMLAPLAGEKDGKKADMAVGFRFGRRTEMPTWRRAGKRVLDYATAAGGGGAVRDSQCGYRAFGPKAVDVMADRLQAAGFGVESEELVLANEAGLRLENVPINCKYEGIDGSTRGPVGHAIGVLGRIVTIVTARHPLIFLGIPCLGLLVVGLLVGTQALQRFHDSAGVSVPYVVAAASIAIMGAVGFLSALVLNLLANLEQRVRMQGKR